MQTFSPKGCPGMYPRAGLDILHREQEANASDVCRARRPPGVRSQYQAAGFHRTPGPSRSGKKKEIRKLLRTPWLREADFLFRLAGLNC